MKVPVSSTRSSLTCSSTGISVISSRNSVPPCARSKKPWCWRSAPVKLPFSWPKISLSIRFGEMAPQLTARNGRARRRLKSCTVRATSSLPVPLSPVTNTVTEVPAAPAALQVVVQGLDLGLQHRRLHQPREDALKLARTHRLDQVVGRAVAQCLDRGLQAGVPGHQHHL